MAFRYYCFKNIGTFIGKEVISYCLDVLNEKMELKQVNVANIVLILKTQNPISMVNFRPTSLCNVIHKIIAKMVTNIFQRVLDVCINKAQNAFVPGHLILDNILLAYKMLHTFSQKRGGQKRLMSLKLDMSKAYDMVE